jgi:hypothetical protein
LIFHGEKPLNQNNNLENIEKTKINNGISELPICPFCNANRLHGINSVNSEESRYKCSRCGIFSGNEIANKIVKDFNEGFPAQEGTTDLRIYVNPEDLAAVQEEQMAQAQAEAEEAEGFDGDQEDQYATEGEARAEEAEYEEELASDTDPSDL